MTQRLMARLWGGTGSVAPCGAGVATVVVSQPPYAFDWGCHLALCLATPGSPTKYAAWWRLIVKLWNALAMGASFPTCTEVRIRTMKVKHGYPSVTRVDGVTSRAALPTRDQSVTPQ